MSRAFQADLSPSPSFRLWSLLAVLPLLMAAGTLEKAVPSIGLPDNDAYRVPLSDTLLESSGWWTKQKYESGWREQSKPSIDWRSQPKETQSKPSSNKGIELFPRYTPGKPSDYDFMTREEKPLINVLEFGSKR